MVRDKGGNVAHLTQNGWAQVDETALGELADYVIRSAYPAYGTEEHYEEHSYHDSPSVNNGCAHCLIYKFHRGQGINVAKFQAAMMVARREGQTQPR